MKINLAELTIKKAQKAFTEGQFTPTDLVKAYLKEIENNNKKLNIYLSVFSESNILEQAQKAEEMLKDSRKTNLTGIPFAIKDNILIKGYQSTSGSLILENYQAPYDATVIKKLKEAGAIFLGKVNLDEFAMGSSTENSAFALTKNPLNTDLVPGGSSGGSAAAVVSNLALVSLGSDTGGSIRLPASFCGLYGLKPTYGSVSRYGLSAMASSLDQIGPLAKSIDDLKIVFDCIKGRDEKFDMTSQDISYLEIKDKYSFAYSFKIFSQLKEDVRNKYLDKIKDLEKQGFISRDIDLDFLSKSLAIYYILMTAESSSNLARYDGLRFGVSKKSNSLEEFYFNNKTLGLGSEVKRRLILGSYVLSAGFSSDLYFKSLKLREDMKKDFSKIFSKFDFILLPTSTNQAYPINSKKSPLESYLVDIFTVSANVCGLPAISIPFSNSSNQMPLGLQIIANRGGDNMIFDFVIKIRFN